VRKISVDKIILALLTQDEDMADGNDDVVGNED